MTASAHTPTELRRARHRRNPQLESLLAKLNEALAPGGDRLAADCSRPSMPPVLVVGAPRSGSTVFMQWLASSSALAVPSNLIARFYRAPAIGAMVERLLFDPALDFRGELALERSDSGFESSLGKTRGPTAPNEFWHFWRRFFPLADPACLDSDALARVDAAGLASELAAWESVAERPLAMKALLLDWHLPWLAHALPNAIFVDLVREPFYVMQSLLGARREFLGDERGWYSIKPPDYPRLSTLDPVEQVAGQLAAIRGAVDDGVSRIAPSRVVRIDYATFCRAPASAWSALREATAIAGHELPATPPSVEAFEARDTVRVEPRRERAMREAWASACGALDEKLANGRGLVPE